MRGMQTTSNADPVMKDAAVRFLHKRRKKKGPGIVGTGMTRRPGPWPGPSGWAKPGV